MTNPNNTGLLGDGIGLPEKSGQLSMFPMPAIPLKVPKQDTLEYACLMLLLQGKRITHPDFLHITGSWRLAAYVEKLSRYGWPIQSGRICQGNTKSIATYKLPAWVMQMAGGKQDEQK